MKCILYIILFCLTFVSCRTQKEMIKTDTVIHSKESNDTINAQLSYADKWQSLDTKTLSYDSSVTHVIIYIYDTIKIDGEQIVKQKIEIDRIDVSGSEMMEARVDSVKEADVVMVSVGKETSIDEENHGVVLKKRPMWNYVMSLLLLVLLLVLISIFRKMFK